MSATDRCLRFSSGSGSLHVAILFVATLATGYICGVGRQPIYSDSGWFLYAAQAVHRGEPLYSSMYTTATRHTARSSARCPLPPET